MYKFLYKKIVDRLSHARRLVLGAWIHNFIKVNSPNCRASICRRVRHFADCLQ